jgi:translation initiation factor RLI1
VIEHDFIMATYLADRVIVFEGEPAIAATATPSVYDLDIALELFTHTLLGRNLCSPV